MNGKWVMLVYVFRMNNIVWVLVSSINKVSNDFIKIWSLIPVYTKKKKRKKPLTRYSEKERELLIRERLPRKSLLYIITH